MHQIVAKHQVNRNSVCSWLYQYSPQHQPQPALMMVQMQSEETNNQQLCQQVTELERNVSRKQPKIGFLNKFMELSSAELGLSGNYGQIGMGNEVYGYKHVERVNGTIRDQRNLSTYFRKVQ